MKIAFFISSMVLGGAERTVAALANEFIKYGDKINIITLDNQTSFYYLDPQVKYINLNTLKDSKNLFDALINNSRTIRALRKIIKKEKIDALISFNTTTMTAAIISSLFLRTRVIGTEMSNPYLIETNKLWQFMKRNISVLADGFIFQTKESTSYFRKAVLKKSTVIPNAVFCQEIPTENISISDRKRDICAVGRLETVKGFDVLIKAFAEFCKVRDGYSLSIYGEGSERENLQLVIDNLKLNDKVFLYGKVSDIPKRIYKSYMFVLSSRFEGMPNALMEAMACGLPCISTDCDFGPRDLIRNGGNGLLVPVDDINALAAAMDTVAQNSDLAEKLSENAKEINNTHSLDIIAKAHHQYIKSIVSGRR